ncbi:MAG: pilus assembly PilX N-terminal domain-containing protein [Armatimonadota bacterium]|nr:pilus assembly PilX N-terminal domain-containing protein [Armatimonadota bacterium]MDR7451938.1 pilus assembly PilX N-terminal domain-containing protein [Armatimonadota bacterium]MDR7466620.1 pilus assembly PilX N-terminal domain-containing protein [Armatimonadota bacterium]MDR7492906.1 pilus assembly PilX N-terminal domain-containing protein [Armatimonadota bacterium]MDR7500433.1 pilus assembly PilX N-terminal domain-containing protein [Armatimonadota bacterium]
MSTRHIPGRDPRAARRAGEAGAALVTVLILVAVLTVIGLAMVDLVLTEIGIAYTGEDAVAAQYIAEGGLARALHELDQDAGWTGVTDALGDGQYQVTVTSSGLLRAIESVGTRNGARQVVGAAVKVVPRFLLDGIVGNTTVTLGGAAPGVTVENAFPGDAAAAVHANNRLGAPAAITVNSAGAVVVGAVTANGSITGISCGTWPWPCDPAAPVGRFPRLDMDSGDPNSYRSRAIATIDPADGLNLYFRGGAANSRCSAPGWNFNARETQRCWDRYVSSRGGTLGAGMSSPVYYVEFNPGERTQYTISTQTIAHRSSLGANNGGGSTTLTIARPAGLAADDVMIAAIAVVGGSTTGITPPAGWTLVPGGANPIDNGTTLRLAVYYKVAGTAEPANYTWTFSASRKASGGIQAYRNVDPAAPIDVALGQATPSGTTHSTPAVTTSVDGTMLVASFAAAAGGTWTPQTPGLVERYDARSTGGAQSTRTSSEGTEQLQAAAGPTGVKSSRTTVAAVGATHILALAPRRVTVDCVGLAASALETLCLRSRPATDSNGNIVYPLSAPAQVTGLIGVFRRDAGTVQGDIFVENVSLRTADYRQQSPAGDPALVAAGAVRLTSTGASAAARTVEIRGIVYTFAGVDNPGGGCVPPSPCGDDLQGSGGTGLDIQHDADRVTVVLRGVVMSNGAILLRDGVSNAGAVAVRHDGAVIEALPTAFMPLSTGNVLLAVSWSSKD